ICSLKKMLPVNKRSGLQFRSALPRASQILKGSLSVYGEVLRMGWRFRHSFKVIPGVRLNLSKSGLSCSIGGAPLTMNIGPRGVYGTASIPGTGISYRERFGGGSETQPQPGAPVLPPSASPHSLPAIPPPAPTPSSFSLPVSTKPVQEVHSASTELLTSNSLK